MKEAIIKLENSYIQLPNIFYTKQIPMKAPLPKLVLLNHELINELEIDEELLKGSEGVDFLCGKEIQEGTVPIAQAYAGHQFGHFTMLGDGRAILLGEYIKKNGERVDIQIKGSGETPYSRGGDGKASLGPMLREYIISEAMKGLKIPTTRSLAVISTGEKVVREKILKGAMLTRTASSYIRVGTFQYASKWGGKEGVKSLADYTINREFKDGKNKENPYRYLLQEVIKKQAELISKWQLVGFVHGVMNTDNMSISGETIDYGPCAFMDSYNPKTVFSSIDRIGRYSYGNQPNIGGWNLSRFAETLVPLLHEEEEQGIKIAQEEISKYKEIYENVYFKGMRGKLGLFNEEEEDIYLIEGLLTIMQKYNSDYTNTFRGLTLNNMENTSLEGNEEFQQWHKLWIERVERQTQSKKESLELMKMNNPSIIPRNYKVEEALEAGVNNGDYTLIHKLLKVISNPYDYSETKEEYLKVKEEENYRTYCGT